MIFRKTEKKDISEVLEIIESAKERMKNMGLDQWQNGYPNENSIMEDVDKGISYVMEENGQILGTSVLTFEKEDVYENMKEGQWLSDGEYAVVHRIAVSDSGKNKGVSGEILKELEKICMEKGIYSIKIDTHEDNEPMKGFLKKNGFEFCGVIYLDREPDLNAKRVTFEKILEKKEV